ncbi:MAG: hypothetical protein GY726_01445 [Proteobacteria bacterium]|nr:hypothetical protein [Pseudomonadota bacterium]
MIINLHGFNSAGNNNTASQLRSYFPDIKVISPTYTVYNFKKGFAELSKIVSEAIESEPPERLTFVASSTGGVFAEMLARKFSAKVVLINPVTNPEILKHLLGENENYKTGEKYEFTIEDFESFNVVKHDMSVPRLVLVDTGDPVIDHAKTKVFYEGYGRYMEFEGDSHRFTFFKEGLPQIRELYNSRAR